MKSDPYQELSERMNRLEFGDLNSKRDALTARIQVARVERNAELSAQASALSRRVHGETESVFSNDNLHARVASMQSRLSEFTLKEEKEIKDILEDQGEKVDGPLPPAIGTPVSDPDGDGKFTPSTQPRDGQGQFREVLARLKENLGVNGNQEILDKLKQTENLDNTGNYRAASKAADDLISTVDALDDGALNADSIVNVRKATKELGQTIANLPLPFSNQAQKVRFSDLPPRLQGLVKDFIARVEDKIGKDAAHDATTELRQFMSGSDMFSQSEVSEQLNKMLRLLT
jgi:hypothetical protein